MHSIWGKRGYGLGSIRIIIIFKFKLTCKKFKYIVGFIIVITHKQKLDITIKKIIYCLKFDLVGIRCIK